MPGVGKFAKLSLDLVWLISLGKEKGDRTASSALGCPRVTLCIHAQVALKGAQVKGRMGAGTQLSLHSPCCVPQHGCIWMGEGGPFSNLHKGALRANHGGSAFPKLLQFHLLPPWSIIPSHMS